MTTTIITFSIFRTRFQTRSIGPLASEVFLDVGKFRITKLDSELSSGDYCQLERLGRWHIILVLGRLASLLNNKEGSGCLEWGQSSNCSWPIGCKSLFLLDDTKLGSVYNQWVTELADTLTLDGNDENWMAEHPGEIQSEKIVFLYHILIIYLPLNTK